MRDRLIELLREAKEHPEKTCPRWELPTCGGCDYNKGDECDRIARLADYLLLNDVLVLPCKVGDKLYGIKTFVSTNYKTVYSFNAPDAAWIIEQKENFGRTIFLTKDEAEAALKEGADNAE